MSVVLAPPHLMLEKPMSWMMVPSSPLFPLLCWLAALESTFALRSGLCGFSHILHFVAGGPEVSVGVEMSEKADKSTSFRKRC